MPRGMMYVLAAAIFMGSTSLAVSDDREAGAPGATRRATQSPDSLSRLDGTVRVVDRQTQWIRVSGGSPRVTEVTLQIVDRTQILVGGRAAPLHQLREGDVVKAAYESRFGINLAESIEVVSDVSGRGQPRR
jgi:hypothetical protein